MLRERDNSPGSGRTIPAPWLHASKASLDWEVRTFLFDTGRFRAEIESSKRCGWRFLTGEGKLDEPGESDTSQGGDPKRTMPA